MLVNSVLKNDHHSRSGNAVTDTVGNDAVQAPSQEGDKLRVRLKGRPQLRRGSASPALAPESGFQPALLSKLPGFLLHRAARQEGGAHSDSTVPT